MNSEYIAAKNVKKKKKKKKKCSKLILSFWIECYLPFKLHL